MGTITVKQITKQSKGFKLALRSLASKWQSPRTDLGRLMRGPLPSDHEAIMPI